MNELVVTSFAALLKGRYWFYAPLQLEASHDREKELLQEIAELQRRYYIICEDVVLFDIMSLCLITLVSDM